MPYYRLERTSEPWLVFDGELIAQSIGERAAGKTQDRWHDVSLYRTDGGQYVVYVIYRTRGAGEFNYSWAELVGVDQFAHVLRSYEPVMNVPGLSGRAQYTTRQAGLLASLRRRFAAQVRRLLRDVAALEQGVK
ncbi:hypothetical protein ES707_09932 [subsurface metagenome]